MSKIKSCISKWLLRVAFYYGIFFGYTYIYVDVNKRLVKSNGYVKIYVYFINSIHGILLLYYAVENIKYNFLYPGNPVLAFGYSVMHIGRVCIFVGVIVLRIREENALKKWFKIIVPLQLTYFDKISVMSSKEMSEEILCLNILVIVFYSLCSLITFFIYPSKGDWGHMVLLCSENYITLMQTYVMLHHVITLCYINICFSKLNQQLEQGQILELFANIYFKLSLLLKEVNEINGPVIFSVLSCLLLSNSFYIFISLVLMISFPEIFLYTFILGLVILILICIHIFLYFLICELVHRTTTDSGRILMLYNVRNKHYLEIEMVCLGRLLLNLNINICGLFSISFSSLFTLILEIITLIIILIQFDYLEL
ncbi:uncharacterized protein ACRADG_009760 [Cochliomyia hominivorax]